MLCRKWLACGWLAPLWTWLLLSLAACNQEGAPDSWQGVCIDQDGDGFGVECVSGPDCDDHDANLSSECGCTAPAEGCACDAGAKPIDCVVSREHTGSGGLLCRTGLRYCQDGAWTECTGTQTFEVPAPPAVFKQLGAALIDQDALPRICDVCRPDCYRVDDPLVGNPDGGVPNSTNTVYAPNGGITLQSELTDAGIQTYPDELDPIPPCTPGVGTDKDCDGIPDALDPYPTAPPFQSDHTTIFMDLAPGESGSSTFEVKFYLNTADIYFLIDMTGSMQEEKDQLFASLKTGNYLDDPSTTSTDESSGVECADRDFNGTADDGLKSQGILGNIACLIRSSGFGLGWYREVPYSAPDNYGIKYGYPNIEPFEHRQDISENTDLTFNALDLLYTRGNQNWAESAGMALYAVATGGPLYMGWDRPGVPAKVCPAGRVGYPCFRGDAVPVVILITDAPMMNGPPTSSGHLGSESSSYMSNKQPYNYQPVGLAHTSFSSDGLYHPVPNTNETFASAYDVGTIDSSFKTYTGDTRGMSADVHAGNLGFTCNVWPSGAGSAGSPGYPDAVFRFRVEEPKLLTVSTRGSRHKPVLAIVPAGSGMGPPALVHVPSSGRVENNGYANVHSLGALPSEVNMQIAGYSLGLPHTFPVSQAPSCFAGSNPSNTASTAYYSFTVAQDMPGVLFSADGGDFDAVLALYEGVAPSSEEYAISNTNDYFGAYPDPASPALLNMNGRSVWHRGGNTEAAAINPDFTASGFWNVNTSDTSCNVASGLANDAVIDFSLTSRTTLHVETTAGDNVANGPSFDNILGLIERPATLAPTIVNVGGNNGVATAHTINSTQVPPASEEGSWIEFRGYTANYTTHNNPVTMTADDISPSAVYDSANSATSTCSSIAGQTGYHDVVFRFAVTEEDDYDIDTLGSGFTTFLSLHGSMPSSVRNITTDTTTSNTDAGQDIGTFDGNTAKVQISGGTSGGITYTPTQVQVPGDASGCRSALLPFTSLNALGRVYRFEVTGATRNFTFSRDTNWNSVVSVFRAPLPMTSSVAGSFCRTLGTFTESLSAGTYYLVVHARNSYYSGNFDLTITDSGVSNGLIACNRGSHPNARGKNSLLRRHLTVGTYYIVVKGNGNSAETTRYQLAIRRTQPPPVIACNHDGLGGRRSAIDRTLDPGNYSVIVRGRSDGSTGGTYGVLIRDSALAPVACHNEAGLVVNGVPTASKSFRANLVAGRTYYLVLRGNNTNKGDGDGAHTIKISTGQADSLCAYDNTTYSAADDASFNMGGAEITSAFLPGEYYAVIKGRGDTASPPNADKGRGWYQLSLGDPLLSRPEQTNTLPVWNTTNTGIKAELNERNIRVITVASTLTQGADCGGKNCSAGGSEANKALNDQGDELARSTGAVDLENKPLRFNIRVDGTGMGYAVVNAVNQLAKNIAMDVSVRFVPQPDRPTPPSQFKFVSRAVNMPGDLCTGPIDTDGDGVLDTHTKCAPGAVPRFEVTFTNPPVTTPASTSQNVRRNPADPNGGYNMRLELIGDGKYIVDRIPVYIIPEDVIPNPSPILYQPTGTYYQDISANGCTGTERPDWQSLYWNAKLPAGTSVEWRVCGGNSVDELDACATNSQWRLAARVNPGNACVDSVQCPNGFCAASGFCEYPVGEACASSAECGVNGACVASGCVWTASPIDLNPAMMNGFNGMARMRVQARLNANGARTAAPTIADFRLNYVCTPGE